MGIKNYRLSLALAPIHPDGKETVNRQGLDYYRRLIDAMLEHGITPLVTL